jgi:hypothetical protein
MKLTLSASVKALTQSLRLASSVSFFVVSSVSESNCTKLSVQRKNLCVYMSSGRGNPFYPTTFRNRLSFQKVTFDPQATSLQMCTRPLFHSYQREREREREREGLQPLHSQKKS